MKKKFRRIMRSKKTTTVLAGANGCSCYGKRNRKYKS